MPRFHRTAFLIVALVATITDARAQSTLRVSDLPEDAPFTVSASATEGVLILDLTLEREWHAYSRDVGGGRPVGVTLSEGGDFRAAGSLIAPGDAGGKLEGHLRLRLPIEATGAGRELNATVHIQVCDALECLPPMSLTVSGEVEPVTVLLVVAEQDDHADRIVDGLRERGFDVARATYEEVSKEQCDARDIVLADSKGFQEHGVSRSTVRAFPRTESPIVAVGFLGTQLIEAHDVAMTSGYI